MSAQEAWTKNRLVAAFREIGLVSGDGVIVHSACSSLGAVEGGADAVIDALLEAVGPKGNLMLPTFNYTRPLPEPYYDPAETPGRTGILSEIGRQRPGALRSLHPTHSVAVIGPEAERLTRDHLACRAFGMGSPIDRMAAMDGKVLLIGVGQIANSTIHIAEEYAGIPKVSWYDPLPKAKVRLPDGRVIEHTLDSSCSCSAAFGGAEGALRRYGEIRDLRAGNGSLQLMRGSDVIRRVRSLLTEKADSLLCTAPGCKPCSGARALLRQRGRL